jgi:hypothetical protein
MWMAKRNSIILIVSILVLATITLWLFAARIASSLIPPLLQNETLQISTLHIASLGFNSARVERLTGHARISTGSIYFDFKNATVSYDLTRLQPRSIAIRQADIEYDPIVVSTTDQTDEFAAAFPADVSIEQLRFTYDKSHEFSGEFKFSGAGENFTIVADDDHSRLEIKGDSSLSALDIAVSNTDLIKIADARLKLVDAAPTGFEFTAWLEPALLWFRNSDLLPASYKNYLDDIGSMSGNIRSSGVLGKTGQWSVVLDLNLQSFSADSFYTSARIRGSLEPANKGWSFTFAKANNIQVSIPSYQLDDISSIVINLPGGYMIDQEFSADDEITLTGNGRASVNFHRPGDADLDAVLTHWTMNNWRVAEIELQDLNAVVPVDLNVDGVKSHFTVTNTSPLHINGNIEISGATNEEWPPNVPGLDLQGEWNWNDGSFDINGETGWSGTTIGQWSLVNHETSGELRVEFKAPVVELFQPMKDYLAQNGHDIEFSNGTLEGSLGWTWDNDHYDNRLGVTTTGVSGRILGLEFESGTLKLNSSDLVAPTFKFEGLFPVVNLAGDIDVTDFNISGRWQSGFHLDRARMVVLGGLVKINPFFLDPRKSTHSFVLEVEKIDLEQILLIVDQEGLGGSGRLSGNIPIRLVDSTVAIDEGRLKNTTRGHIGYDTGQETVPQLDNIAMQALRDFRYDLLDATLDYQPNGDYRIGARLEGRNPELYNGYPIAFNINLTGTLPGLLRASLITGDFHSEILRKIQNEQQGQ